MYIDKQGNKRYKLGLHVHTTLSDGLVTPELAAAAYRNAGFDAIAITDHWKYHDEDNISGLKIISGCEYNLGGGNSIEGVMHIVGIGMKSDPMIQRSNCTRQSVINQIRSFGGIAILAHPAWSLNRPSDATALNGFSAVEIYNTVSDVHESFRPYSGYFVDLLANEGCAYPLIATDDAHYYDGSDACRSYIMVKADGDSTDELLNAVAQGDFYATQGPELLVRRYGKRIIVDCSPADEIFFISNSVWCPERALRDSGRTHAEYIVNSIDNWVRVEIRSGKDWAWSNIIMLNK